jgi:hypothetical protein
LKIEVRAVGLKAMRQMLILLVVLALAACTMPTGETSVSPSPSRSISSELPSGIYVNGPQGTPHYFIALTDNADGTFRGTVSLLAQDGQTSAVFTFTATNQSGIATLTTSSGRIITGPYGAKALTLGECTAYLQFVQSLADCTFTFAPGGLSH